MTPAPFSLTSVVLASGNVGKLREFDALLAPLGIRLIAQGKLNILDAPEPYPTFLENALAKARHASLLSGLPALADDSGLCVAALNAEPGIHSARYAEAEHGSRSDAANNQKLLRVLQGQSNRRAWYVAVLVLVTRHDDPQPLIAQANWFGEIVDQPQGSHGFGYDPYFYLPEQGCTVAQLDPTLKNKISHRGQALQQLLGQLATQGLVAPAALGP
ncbi:MAG: non-canonical purine NTP pyrophosphatase, RdgB/HAM1 family [Alcaligenaceae bacterium]|nr:MAG: non-canonical purine NTP pyrophosphatase, RdgB/HAM1 family [Alcaligenaceae bacterium]